MTDFIATLARGRDEDFYLGLVRFWAASVIAGALLLEVYRPVAFVGAPLVGASFAVARAYYSIRERLALEGDADVCGEEHQ